jgi:hypothetical protein
MTYRIEGLKPEAFASLFSMTEGELAERNARRVTAGGEGGYPCRVSLEEAAPGDELVLLNFVSHDVPTPFRTSYAIYVRKDAAPARYTGEMPPMLDRRTLSLRAFDRDAMLRAARLAEPGTADEAVRELFEQGDIATIHAHNAAYGCFLARIERN